MERDQIWPHVNMLMMMWSCQLPRLAPFVFGRPFLPIVVCTIVFGLLKRQQHQQQAHRKKQLYFIKSNVILFISVSLTLTIYVAQTNFFVMLKINIIGLHFILS